MLTKIFSPNICYFVAILSFVANYALYGNLWTQDVLFFWSKTVLGKILHSLLRTYEGLFINDVITFGWLSPSPRQGKVFSCNSQTFSSKTFMSKRFLVSSLTFLKIKQSDCVLLKRVWFGPCKALVSFRRDIVQGLARMSHLLLLGKFEYTGEPIFNVVLEC